MPIRISRLAITCALALALAAACTGTEPLPQDEVASTATASRPAAPSAIAVRPSEAASFAVSGAITVALLNATGDKVTIDVTDASRTLISATSGTPGDGASVDADKLHVRNLSATSVRLTWVGGPCDSANSLSIDEARRRLLLVQPECPGDAIANDRILDLAFSTPVLAAELEPFLQDGLDTAS